MFPYFYDVGGFPWFRSPRKEKGTTKSFLFLFGVTGFEPAASWSRTKHSTKLSHTPIAILFYHKSFLLSSVFLLF